LRCGFNSIPCDLMAMEEFLEEQQEEAKFIIIEWKWKWNE